MVKARICSATDWRLEPLEEVKMTPEGRMPSPSYSSVPAHMVWNHLRRAAPFMSLGLGQPRITVAWAICSEVSALRPA